MHRIPVTLDLYATQTGELIASVPVPGGAIVNPERRLIGGLAAPWNLAGQPGLGGGPARVILRAGSIIVPEDPGWVKFLIEHDPNRSVGFLARWADTAAGLLSASRIAAGPAGDQALADVASRVRDGLSVRSEVDRWNVLDDGTVEVLASRLREISSVAVPAYEPARASVLAASIPSQERESIMRQMRHMLDLTASAPVPTGTAAQPDGSQAQPNINPPSTPPPTQTGQPAPAPAGGQLTAAAGDPAAFAAALAPLLAQHFGRPAAPGELPAAPPAAGAATTRPRLATLRAAADRVVSWQNEGGNFGTVGTLLAALNDVVPANDAGGASGVGNDVAPQWIGELWTARRTGRPYVDSLGTPSRLTGLKAKGWRWVTKPVMDDYAGDKAAIPSNAVSTEPAEANAHREAGGWDVDRAFVDLGDAAFIESMFQAATESWTFNSNAWLGGQLLAAAIAADADGIPSTSFLNFITQAAGAAAGVGSALSAVAIAGDVFADVAGLTKDQVPWWFGTNVTLDLGNQTGEISFRVFVDPALAAGVCMAYDRRAATYYEQGATPIRVQAVNIPNGGVDLGVFGYNAVIINDDRALFHTTIV